MSRLLLIIHNVRMLMYHNNLHDKLADKLSNIHKIPDAFYIFLIGKPDYL